MTELSRKLGFAKTDPEKSGKKPVDHCEVCFAQPSVASDSLDDRLNLVPFVGIELTTYRLQGGCSTTELKRRIYILLDDLQMTDSILSDGGGFLYEVCGLRH